jgi:hypothetical protein
MHGVATVDCSDDAFDIQITVAAYAYLNRMRKLINRVSRPGLNVGPP